MNYEIRKFQDDLVCLINSAKIPIEVKRIVMENVMNKVVSVAEEIVMKEYQEKNKEDECNAVSEN